MLVITISGTFIYFLTINVIIRVTNYAATCIALPILRKKQVENLPAFKAPAGILASIVSTALCIWIISSSGWREIIHADIAALIGLPLFILFRFLKRTPN